MKLPKSVISRLSSGYILRLLLISQKGVASFLEDRTGIRAAFAQREGNTYTRLPFRSPMIEEEYHRRCQR